MAALDDKVLLQVDGCLHVDPAQTGLRQRAQAFLASRQWTTNQLFYTDQAELVEARALGRPTWSMAFGLGLDHVTAVEDEWFADVAALLAFVQAVQAEVGNKFVVQVRFRRSPWHSKHITRINGQTLRPAWLRASIRRATL